MDLEISRLASEACEQIINEMGADLHDDLIQKLSVFRLYMDRLERSSADPSEVRSITLKMRSDFEQVITSVKTASRKLLPASAEGESLDSMIELLCQNMEQPGAGNIHFSSFGVLKHVENQTKKYLLRITQELVHNALRHSSAWHIWVRLKSELNVLTLQVEDDGTGTAKISEFIDHIKKKNNTLRIRTQAIGASIDYLRGEKGLLAVVKLKY